MSIPLGDVIDLAAERGRLAKNAAAAEKERDALAARLAAPGFVERVRRATLRLPPAFRRPVALASAGADAGLLGIAALVEAKVFFLHNNSVDDIFHPT